MCYQLIYIANMTSRFNLYVWFLHHTNTYRTHTSSKYTIQTQHHFLTKYKNILQDDTVAHDINFVTL